ncbi:hypothetical protein N5D48_11235 [Pseudomonas sp. GD03858]|uniref:hypothetical protein n=1 Tax=unclassified Pseudomonas TaxID=196821 RepID=UPI00244831BA|nr:MULTISPECIES: hypothetical protein [unclassified Pseudomonas]MDH0646479.1 hypothetical protein [Pseudomonas sp. GD03867]MDH0662980.1 hypothetical protein [Pseudomonas sp. GD03858]
MWVLYGICYALVVGTLVDWACRSRCIRFFLYIVFNVTGMTACNQLGEEQFLQLDGIGWSAFFVAIAAPLLFKRSRYFERDRD